MGHENSKTVDAFELGLNQPNRWYNVYGPGTPKEGMLLPIQYDWEKSYYPSAAEAAAAAARRSEEHGKPQPNALIKLLQAVGIVQNPSARPIAKPASGNPLQQYRDRRLQEEELLKPQGNS